MMNMPLFHFCNSAQYNTPIPKLPLFFSEKDPADSKESAGLHLLRARLNFTFHFFLKMFLIFSLVLGSSTKSSSSPPVLRR